MTDEQEAEILLEKAKNRRFAKVMSQVKRFDPKQQCDKCGARRRVLYPMEVAEEDALLCRACVKEEFE